MWLEMELYGSKCSPKFFKMNFILGNYFWHWSGTLSLEYSRKVLEKHGTHSFLHTHIHAHLGGWTSHQAGLATPFFPGTCGGFSVIRKQRIKWIVPGGDAGWNETRVLYPVFTIWLKTIRCAVLSLLLSDTIRPLQMLHIFNTKRPESPALRGNLSGGKTCYTFRSSRPGFGVSVHFSPARDFMCCVRTGHPLFPADGHTCCLYLVCTSRSTVSRTRSQERPSLVLKMLWYFSHSGCYLFIPFPGEYVLLFIILFFF